MGITNALALLDKPAESLVRALAGEELVRGKGISQLGEREAAALGNLDGAREPLGGMSEELRHLFTRSQMGFGIGKNSRPHLVERSLLTNALEDVGELLLRGLVEERARGGDDGQSVMLGDLARLGLAERIAREKVPPSRQKASIVEGIAEDRRQAIFVRSGEDRDEASGMRCKHVEREGGLLAAPLCMGSREKTAEVRIAFVALREEDDGSRFVFAIDLGAHDMGLAGLLCREMRPHGAMDSIAIGDGDGNELELSGTLDHLPWLRGAFEEREAALCA